MPNFMRNANNILKRHGGPAFYIPLTFLICVILSLTYLPCSARDQRNFTKINIDPAFKDLLYSAPDLMHEGGARLLQDGHKTALIGIGKVVLEDLRPGTMQKARRIGEIRARTAVLELGGGVEISTSRGMKETASLSSIFQVTESRVKGEIQQLPAIGSWFCKGNHTFYVAVGKIVHKPQAPTGNFCTDIHFMEAHEPFTSLLRRSPVLCTNGGVRGFVLKNKTKALISVGSALIKTSLPKAIKIARLKAIRSLLAHQNGIYLVSVESLVDQESLELHRDNQTRVSLSAFLSVTEEQVSGTVKALPVVATWKDAEGSVVFVAIGSLLHLH